MSLEFVFILNMSFMAMFELYRRSTIGMCLTETLDEWFQLGSLAVKLLSKCLFSLTSQWLKHSTLRLRPR
ncbi:putative transcription factor IIA, alpha-helical domain-containing protein [Helianthus debilis subsp. tardiflorus]